MNGTIVRAIVDFLNPNIYRVDCPHGSEGPYATVTTEAGIFLVCVDMESANIRILTKFPDYKTYSYNLVDPQSIEKARMKIVDLLVLKWKGS